MAAHAEKLYTYYTRNVAIVASEGDSHAPSFMDADRVPRDRPARGSSRTRAIAVSRRDRGRARADDGDEGDEGDRSDQGHPSPGYAESQTSNRSGPTGGRARLRRHLATPAGSLQRAGERSDRARGDDLR